MKEKLSIPLEELDKDLFNYLTTFMSYKKDLTPLLLVSKKMNELVSQCPGGELAKQILPQSKSIEQSTPREFFFKYILQKNNIKPFLIVLSCMYLLCEGDEALSPIYLAALTTALAFTVWNIRTESHNFGLFKNHRQEAIRQLNEPLEKSVDFTYNL